MANYPRNSSPRPDGGIPTWMILVGFIFAPPLGLVLLLLKGLRISKAQPPRPYNGLPPENMALEQTEPKEPAPRRKTSGKSSRTELWVARLSLFFGVILLLSAFSILSEALFYYSFDTSLSFLLNELGGGVTTAVLGGLLTAFGLRTRKLLSMRRTLKLAIGKRDSISLKEIARILSCDAKTALAAAESAIDKGELGNSAFVDRSSDLLILRGGVPQQEPEREPQPKPDPAQKNSQYEAILQQLRDINNAIPGKEMSAKISRLEDISAKIFELAEKDPDKLPQLRKFLNYYLPTSLKLLSTYAQLDAQGVEGRNIAESKRQIENNMDVLCDAFAAQLDKLFHADALDVSADIAAMQSMLQQDGLAVDTFGSDPFGLDKDTGL